MQRGSWLLIAVLMIIFVAHLIRGRFVQPAPDFLFATGPGVRLIEFGQGFCPAGVHQFFDDPRGPFVNDLTKCDDRQQGLLETLDTALLRNGEKIEIIDEFGQKIVLNSSWMSAARRISLGIPLHPDRMTQEDWTDLPGIGEKTAANIEADRQNNGDFGCLEALQRVNGLGTRRIDKFRKFF